MNGIVKVLTAILGIMAVIACLATVGIIGYSMLGGKKENTETQIVVQVQQPTADPVPSAAPTPESDTGGEDVVPVNLSGHIHDYTESVEKKATCYSAGRLKYTCACGDSYYVDVLSTGHVADEWVITKLATEELEGLKVQKCIYCDEIIAQEVIPREESKSETVKEEPVHVHQYTAAVEREPSCVLAGLRKYTCSCGNFYTEMIPAAGHVATDWTVAAEATATHLGTEQRTCNVCGVVLDSRPYTKASSSDTSGTASASPATSAQTAATATPNSSASASTSPGASASPGTTVSHQHSYTSYVLKEANCTEKGIRSFVCTCGSEYAESIELDMNNHTYRGVVIAATSTTQGYTVFTCTRCNYSYYDNYTPALGQ
ncbi:MAG: hypothetical protein IJ409_00890 [Lachnospiraceae bacterium]|nr:hypothetical protein [Lachnospiraceae bacterium]